MAGREGGRKEWRKTITGEKGTDGPIKATPKADLTGNTKGGARTEIPRERWKYGGMKGGREGGRDGWEGCRRFALGRTRVEGARRSMTHAAEQARVPQVREPQPAEHARARARLTQEKDTYQIPHGSSARTGTEHARSRAHVSDDTRVKSRTGAVHATGSTQPAEHKRGRAHRKIHGLPYLRGNCRARTRVQPASMHVAEHARQQGGDAAWREGRLGARGTGAAPNMPWPPI